MEQPPDPALFAKRVIAKFGGVQAARTVLFARFAEIEARWEQDTDAIGRILRSHLFVEHSLEAYLSARAPGLRSIADSRLSFAQKLSLAPLDEPGLTGLRPGIKRLNAVRNRLAHTLRAGVTEGDAQVFLSSRLFAALRLELAKPSQPCEDPLVVLEAFASHCGSMLDSAIDNPFASCFDSGESEAGAP